MTLEEGRPETASRNRRAFLLAGGAAVIPGLAGCTGDGDEQDSPAATESDTATDTPSPTAIAADGLLAHYTLDGDTPTDASGNGNDATIGGPMNVDVSGQVDGAYEYTDQSPTNDGGSHLALPAFGLSGDDSHTLACWINADELSASSGYEGTNFFWLGGGGDGSKLYLQYFGDGNNSRSNHVVRHSINEGDDDDFGPEGGNGIGLEGDDVVQGDNLPLNQWFHLAATYDDSTGEWKLYVDGSQLASKTDQLGESDSLDLNFTGEENTIGGQRNDDLSRTFDGKIDEVRIYDRALSESEVQALASQSS